MDKIRKQTKLWKIRDGSKIRICDMSDGHITNSIKMLLRSYKVMLFNEWNQLMAYIGNDPPDGAYWAATGEIGQLEGILWGTENYMGPSLGEAAEKELPILRSLMLEKLRRKNINKDLWNKFITKLKRKKHGVRKKAK
ncbi:hypothetical protein LCGC14_1662320 [marine sediment metagenome]|uniref:Uncharacterized protein n=1 Tax=marine sediment metagenome TaxID=412755 RepID=A0A0F9HUD7_9ZZZZ